MLKLAALWSVGISAAAVYAAYCGLLFVSQRWMLFPGDRLAAQSNSAPGNAEVLWLQTQFGQVESWYFAPEKPAPSAPSTQLPLVIAAHGNGELIDTFPVEFRGFVELGMAVLLVEYPGYGRSDGSPSQATVTEAFVAAYDTMAARGDIDTNRIVFFGRSLGGGAVCALAAERDAAALILLSTFTNIRSMAHRFLAPTFLVRDCFDNLEVVRSYAGPVLVMHGSRDRLIPHSHGLALSEAASRGTMVTYDCDHGDCPPDWTTFWRDVTGFLTNEPILTLQ